MKNKVVIVIVSYNSCHLMQECIKSIRATVNTGQYKIVVVDNASDDGVAEWLEGQDDILLIRNSSNVGFGPACNQAVAATIGTEYEDYDVFLLNNDTRLTENALYNLQTALYSAADIGAAGAVSNYAGNRQQVDILYDSVEAYLEYGKTNNVLSGGDYEERIRLSGFAMLIRREAWDKTGGFDEDFAPGYFEDDALSMELARNGYRMLLVRNCVIYHAGSQSFSKTDYNALLEDHRRLFENKYSFDILEYAYPNKAVLLCISQAKEGSFKLLHIGCGLGADLKAIRSMCPECEAVGVEYDAALFGILKNNEKAYNSVTGLVDSYEEGYFDILILSDGIKDDLSREEKEILVSLCKQDALLLHKNRRYEALPYEDIKLIIWDLDDTLWTGTLSETEVIVPELNAQLIGLLADHGIVNSISSKNDEEPVKNKLNEAGIWDYFVFNNINWAEKGEQIADKLKEMGLRAENTLFIDDNPRNLEEALFCNPGLMTAGPDIIPYLACHYAELNPRDMSHTRLEQYKLLERKLDARKPGVSKEEFLSDSNIKIMVNRNCLEEIDRIHELVMRTNQLNFTKHRDDKELLTRQITNDWNECAYIRIKDRFGDYGTVGFYCYNRRERSMEHFLFSCRVLGMGVEQYVYNMLGCPDFNIEKPVAVQLEKDKEVPWITESFDEEISEDKQINKRVRILLKGPCDMSAIEPYLAGARITTEFNYVNDRGFVTTGQNHSVHIRESAELTKAEIDEIVNEVPFIIEGDFDTKIFSNEYHIICYSLQQDMTAGLYKKKNEERYVAFGGYKFDLTDNNNTQKYIDKEIQGHDFNFTHEIIDDFAKGWEFIGNTPFEVLLGNLDYIYENVPGKPLIIFLLGSELPYEGSDVETDGLCDIYREINPVIEAFAEDHERVRIINPTKFIHSQDDYNGNINHFSRNVYYEIAGEISRYVNEYIESLGKRKSRSENTVRERLDMNNEQLEKRIKELEDTVIKLQYDVLICKGRIASLPYDLRDPELDLPLCKPHIMSRGETLRLIIDEHRSIARFGDGEFALMDDVQRWSFQKADKKLGERLKEVLKSDDNILIGLNPDFYANNIELPDDKALGVMMYMTYDVRKQHAGLLDQEKMYADALCFRKMESMQDFNMLSRLWRGRKCLFVEGLHTGLGVGNRLFSSCGSISRLICPAENAFDRYDDILNAALEFDKDALILIALGPTASVLSYDLYKAGYQAVDIGQLDLQYEAVRSGTDIVNLVLPDKYCTTDVTGNTRMIKSIEDPEYKAQIWKTII